VRVGCSETGIRSLALQVAELVLADLDLVAVGEPVGLDPAAVDVGPVERAEVVDVEAVAAADQQRVVAGDGDVVEEYAGVGAAADADPVFTDAEALAGASPAGGRTTTTVQLAFFSASSNAEPTSQPASRPRSFAPTTSRSAVPQKLSSARPGGL